MKLNTLVIAMALTGVAHGNAFDSAFSSAMDSALGEPSHKLAEYQLAKKQNEYDHAESKGWLTEAHEQMLAEAKAEYQAYLDDIAEQIKQDLISQGLSPEPETPPMPEPEDPPIKDAHLAWGYDDEGGPISLEQWEEGSVVSIVGLVGGPYATLQAACESYTIYTRPQFTDVGYTAFGQVAGGYACTGTGCSQDTPVSEDQLIRTVLENDAARIECWSNVSTPSRENDWDHEGPLYVQVPDAASCTILEDDETYEYHLPNNDVSVTYHVQIDLTGPDWSPDGIPDTQHSMIDHHDSEPPIIHSGLGVVTETLTYDDLAAIVPADMYWDGQANLRVFGVRVEDGKEVIDSVALGCVKFGGL